MIVSKAGALAIFDLYACNTSDGRKISVAREAMELPNRVNTVNITEGEQLKTSFLAIKLNNRIPAIVD